jgi:hypothetical protein
MTKTFRLERIQDVVEIATTLTESWFRGQSKPYNSLVPRIFREWYRDPMYVAFRSDIELDTIEEFKRHAPLLAGMQVPEPGDRFAWLCLMQHYRAPTRLLDWSTNALASLHFAVSSDPSEDGELWAMLPTMLNAKAGAASGFPLIWESPHIRYLVEEPYSKGTPGERATRAGLTQPVTSPVAVKPIVFFPRVAAQGGVFTLHPQPEETRSIVDVLPEPEHLVRYLIPAQAKQRLHQQLENLGVTERYLFPDLEGLARTIVAGHASVAYGPPRPPLASGEVEPTTVVDDSTSPA